MSTQKFSPPKVEAPYLQFPPGRTYVRSFLFTRRVDAPLASVHPIVRVLLIFCLSFAQFRAINTAQPDLLAAIVLWVCGVGLFVASGAPPAIGRFYALIMIPTLFSLLFSWTVFGPVHTGSVWFEQRVYTGFIDIGFAVWQIVWLGIVGGYFWWRRSLVTGILLATGVCIILSYLIVLPVWTIARVEFLSPFTVVVSDQGVYLAVTKLFGYSGMLLSTLALILTSRDVELIGALRQLRVPQPVIFFLSTMFRALSLAITDFETIRQAQKARAIDAQPRSFLRRVLDMGGIAVPMVAMMIRRSSEIGDALHARGYTIGRKNVDFYETTPLRRIDGLMLAVCVVLLVMAMWPYAGLTALFLKGW